MEENKGKKPNKTLKAIESNVQAEQVKTPVGTAAVDDRFKEIEEKIKFVRDIMFYMIVVLLIGFMAAIIAYFQFVRQANIEYKNTVTEFNNIIKTRP